jgi:hypothetical protein
MYVIMSELDFSTNLIRLIKATPLKRGRIEAAEIGLRTYMTYMTPAGKRTILDAGQSVPFGNKSFEVINEFVYLGAL